MLNTREKLIDILRKTRYEYRRYIGMKDMEKRLAKTEEEFLSIDDSILGEIPFCADYLLSNGVTVQEWISVKDRLPEDDLPQDTKRCMIRCFVYTDKGTVKACVRQRYKKKIDGQWVLCPWEWNKDVFAKPTHWMPLPQPPKGE